jgi:hypothetical protein
VELTWSGEQFSRNQFVKLQGGEGQLFTALPDRIWEWVTVQEPFEDRLENLLHVRVAGLWHAQHKEVPKESSGELVATSTGSCSTGNQSGIDDILPIEFCSVVKTLLIQELPQ